MDLNLLYTQHQRSLMQAAAAPDRPLRAKHLAAAGEVASRIGNYQLAKGAAAAAEWLGHTGHASAPACTPQGVSA